MLDTTKDMDKSWMYLSRGEKGGSGMLNQDHPYGARATASAIRLVPDGTRVRRFGERVRAKHTRLTNVRAYTAVQAIVGEGA